MFTEYTKEEMELPGSYKATPVSEALAEAQTTQVTDFEATEATVTATEYANNSDLQYGLDEESLW